jgi:hypothetical protein
MPLDKPEDCRDALTDTGAQGLVDAALKLVQIQALVANGSPQALDQMLIMDPDQIVFRHDLFELSRRHSVVTHSTLCVIRIR